MSVAGSCTRLAVAGVLALAMTAPAGAAPHDGGPRGSGEERATTVPLTIHLARRDGAPVVTEAWLAAQLARANTLLAAAGLAVAADLRTPLSGEPDVMTVGHRHALARHTGDDGRIHVFVVGELANKDEPGLINGVHWRYRGEIARLQGRRYIILASKAADHVLAHELGHFFGLSHVTQTDNLMSYDRTGAEPFLTDAQQKRIRRQLRRAIRTGRVAPLPASGEETDAASR